MLVTGALVEVLVSPFWQDLEACASTGTSCDWHQKILAWVWAPVMMNASYFWKLELNLWAPT